MEIHGRAAEQARLHALLEAARAGSGGALVVHGEPGVGKSTLLADLLRSARDGGGEVTVLRTQGIESEAPLPFAALQRLLRPVMRYADRLPAPQATALRVALGEQLPPADAGGGADCAVPAHRGHGDGRSERFLMFLGTLNLLAAAADERPVLAVVDDAHWLDEASAAALLFAARRLSLEPVAVVFGARDGDLRAFDAGDLPALHLGGLDRTGVQALLADRTGTAVSAEVSAQLLAATGGNPLALVELPQVLTAGQLEGRAALPGRLPATGGVERVFAERAERLGPDARRLLLVVAADDSRTVTAPAFRTHRPSSRWSGRPRAAWGSTPTPSTRWSAPAWSPSPRTASSSCGTRWSAPRSTTAPPPSPVAPRTAPSPTPSAPSRPTAGPGTAPPPPTSRTRRWWPSSTRPLPGPTTAARTRPPPRRSSGPASSPPTPRAGPCGCTGPPAARGSPGSPPALGCCARPPSPRQPTPGCWPTPPACGPGSSGTPGRCSWPTGCCSRPPPRCPRSTRRGPGSWRCSPPRSPPSAPTRGPTSTRWTSSATRVPPPRPGSGPSRSSSWAWTTSGAAAGRRPGARSPRCSRRRGTWRPTTRTCCPTSGSPRCTSGTTSPPGASTTCSSPVLGAPER